MFIYYINNILLREYVTRQEKAIEIDTLPGMNVEFDNDWTEYLKKTMISGMGVPAAYLNYHEEIDFAKSLSMVNGNFLRGTVIDQKPLGTSYTKLYRLLYRNEYTNYIMSSDMEVEIERYKKNHNRRFNTREKQDNVDLSKLEAKFPSPASLNLTNMIEQLNSASQVADMLLDAIVGQQADDNTRKYGKFAIMKDLCSNIDFVRYKKLIDKELLTSTEEIIKSTLTGNVDENDYNNSSNSNTSSNSSSSNSSDTYGDASDFNF